MLRVNGADIFPSHQIHYRDQNGLSCIRDRCWGPGPVLVLDSTETKFGVGIAPDTKALDIAVIFRPTRTAAALFDATRSVLPSVLCGIPCGVGHAPADLLAIEEARTRDADVFVPMLADVSQYLVVGWDLTDDKEEYHRYRVRNWSHEIKPRAEGPVVDPSVASVQNLAPRLDVEAHDQRAVLLVDQGHSMQCFLEFRLRVPVDGHAGRPHDLFPQSLGSLRRSRRFFRYATLLSVQMDSVKGLELNLIVGQLLQQIDVLLPGICLLHRIPLRRYQRVQCRWCHRDF